uniref:Uncharacterized protein n=1 Tax=Siphoviridae sp. ctgEn20 TaxID=2825606 RepID=A0A8S5P5X6_9CAUD|nr:MAG TPA: hypothetical protein [Siphoviridae sp. ctgEn20]
MPPRFPPPLRWGLSRIPSYTRCLQSDLQASPQKSPWRTSTSYMAFPAYPGQLSPGKQECRNR